MIIVVNILIIFIDAFCKITPEANNYVSVTTLDLFLERIGNFKYEI